LGGSKDSLKLVKTLKQLGKLVLLVDKNQECICKKLADLFICYSIWDHENIIDQIKDLQIAISLTRSSGYASVSCIKINNFLGLTEMTSEIAESLINKEKIYDSGINNIVNLPKKITYSNHKLIPDSYFPLIIKPALEKMGKLTTYKITNLDSINISYENAKKNSITNTVICQKYISGFDISLIGYAIDNRYKYPVLLKEENSFKENGNIVHSGFILHENSSLKKELVRIANNIVRKFYINFSPLNLSFRISDNQIYLVEINLDFGGEGILEYIESKLEIDHIKHLIENFLHSNKKSINI